MVCPFIKTCDKFVSFQYFREHCYTKYNNCQYFKEQMLVTRLPLDWLLLIRGTEGGKDEKQD